MFFLINIINFFIVDLNKSLMSKVLTNNDRISLANINSPTTLVSRTMERLYSREFDSNFVTNSLHYTVSC